LKGWHLFMASSNGSLTVETFNRLRSDIIQGNIRPNERLIAADLAAAFNISRTPIREALQLLEAEDLVVAVKRGYVVREHSRDEIREIYEVRAALEGMAARLVAEHKGLSAVRTIEAVGAHKDEIGKTKDKSRVVDLNTQFHAAIFVACGNERLARMNRSNSQHFFNYRIAELYTNDEQMASIREHARIIKAIRAHDGDAAETAAREHVLNGLKVTLSKLR